MEKRLPIWVHGWLGKIRRAIPPKKEDIYSHIKMEYNNADFAHTKRVCQDFETKI